MSPDGRGWTRGAGFLRFAFLPTSLCAFGRVLLLPILLMLVLLAAMH